MKSNWGVVIQKWVQFIFKGVFFLESWFVKLEWLFLFHIIVNDSYYVSVLKDNEWLIVVAILLTSIKE